MALRTSIEKDMFCCPVCFEDMLDKQPRALNCLHTFCQNCLQDIIKDSCSRKVNADAIVCPSCRKETGIPSEGVESLPLNFNLLSMKEILEQSMEGSNSKVTIKEETKATESGSQKPPSLPPKSPKVEDLCISCKHDGRISEAVVRCVQCDDKFCEHHKERHEKVPIFSKHEIEVLVKEMCQVHRKRLSLVCKSCVEVLCSTCAMARKHMSHPQDIQKYAEVLEEAKKDSNILLEEILSEQTKTDSGIKDLENNLAFLNQLRTLAVKRGDEIKRDIGEEMNKMVNKIDTVHRKPANTAKYIINKRIKTIEKLLEENSRFESKGLSSVYLILASWLTKVESTAAESVDISRHITEEPLPEFVPNKSEVTVGNLRRTSLQRSSGIYRRPNDEELEYLRASGDEATKRRSTEGKTRRWWEEAESRDTVTQSQDAPSDGKKSYYLFGVKLF